jgi:nitrite reductase (NO-forming)
MRTSVVAIALAIGLASTGLFALLDDSPLARGALNLSTSSIETSFVRGSGKHGDPSLATEATNDDGLQKYRSYCVACHQSNGQGLADVFPPLAKSDYLLADPERAARGVIDGQSGPMIVRGRTYRGFMPPVSLNDEDIACVLSYVLNAWGNSHSPITPDQVREIRAKLASNRATPSTASQVP